MHKNPISTHFKVQLNMSFVQCRGLVLDVTVIKMYYNTPTHNTHRSQNSHITYTSHTTHSHITYTSFMRSSHTYTHCKTNIGIGIVFTSFQSRVNPPKTGNRKFSRYQYALMNIKENNNAQRYYLQMEI